MAEKKEKKDKKPIGVGVWLPICKVVAEDYDEETGHFVGSHNPVLLQQNSKTKQVRAIPFDG